MGRVVDVDDLVSAGQVARRYGITLQAVDLWTRKPDFPAPVLRLGPNRLWLIQDVEAWRASRPPPPGPKPHGTLRRYRLGCRCDLCQAANTEEHRRWRGGAQLAADDPRHGTANGYKNFRCRCVPCRAAGSADNREQRERRSTP